MNADELKTLLEQVKNGNTEIDSAIEKLKDLPFSDIGHTRIDNHRELRQGYPEVIYGSGKTIEQVTDIVSLMLTKGNNILVTQLSKTELSAVIDFIVFNHRTFVNIWQISACAQLNI